MKGASGMPARSFEDRSLISKLAAAERWGHEPDRVAATAPARAGLRAKFEREADPDGSLPVGERARRADSLMKAHMLRMSLRAKASRRKAAEHTAVADAAEAELTGSGGPDAA